MIARPLLMQTQLPTSAWGHAVLYSASLLKYRPSAYNILTPHHLAFGVDSNISHFCTFGCQVLVPIMGPKRTKMGPKKQKGTYIGYDSSSIIHYLEPYTTDVFQARFVYCHFFEDTFPKLFQEHGLQRPTMNELKWQTTSIFWNDSRTRQCEDEVKRILQLARTVEEMLDAFNDFAQVKFSHIPAANTPARLQILIQLASDQPPRAKHGCPVGAKDTQPTQKRLLR